MNAPLPPPPKPAPTPDAASALEKDIKEWTAMRNWMALAKEKEAKLRQSIADRIFGTMRLPTGAFPEGTVHTMAEGSTYNYKATLETKWNRTLLEELITVTMQEAGLTLEEQSELLRRKYELGVKAYKELPADKRAVVDKMVVTKQGAITLELTAFPKS
jgi:hypothetical protein